MPVARGSHSLRSCCSVFHVHLWRCLHCQSYKSAAHTVTCRALYLTMMKNRVTGLRIYRVIDLVILELLKLTKRSLP